MNGLLDLYLPHEIAVLARMKKNALKEFNAKVKGANQPSVNKVRARFQSIDDLMKKAHLSGVLNYGEALNSGLWISKLVADDLNKKPGSIKFAQHHRLSGKSVVEAFIHAADFAQRAAEYYVENEKPLRAYADQPVMA